MYFVQNYMCKTRATECTFVCSVHIQMYMYMYIDVYVHVYM